MKINGKEFKKLEFVSGKLSIKNKNLIVKELQNLINSTTRCPIELTYLEESESHPERVYITKVEFVPVPNACTIKVNRIPSGVVDVSGATGVELCNLVLNSQFLHKEQASQS